MEAPAKTALPVLIIDDSETDREITAHCLGKAWPFEREMAADFAADGHEALEKMRGTRYALIALDWKLPGMGGGEVLRNICQTGVRIPVVVLSGLRRDQIAENIESLGASFLNKDDMDPVSFHEAIAESIRFLGLTRPHTTAETAP